MNTTITYTPLESLLLFQSLTVWGTDPDVFIRTSTILKTNALIRDGDTYDPGRLSPDALRELYLQLLREELRIEATQAEGKGDASPNRKRKLASPQLPAIKDANEFSEKLPQLVDRLYGRYRDLMIKSIREDERKYEALQREIAEIERGEWDERILREDRARSKRTPSAAVEDVRPVGTAGNTLRSASKSPQDEEQVEAQSTSTLRDTHEPQKESSPLSEPESAKESKPKAESSTSTAVDDEESLQSIYTGQTARAQEETATPILPQIGQQANSNQDLPSIPPTLHPNQQRSPENWKWEQHQSTLPPHSQSHYPPVSNYPPSSLPPYPQYPQGPHRGSFPVLTGNSLPPQNHSSSSPLNNNHVPLSILPTPNGGRGPGSPGTQHLNQLADAAEQQQYRPTSASPLIPQSGLHGAQYGLQYPQYPPQPMNDGRTSTGASIPPQWNSNYAPAYPVPLSNYSYHQPQAAQQSFSSAPNIVQSVPRQYNSPYIPSHGPRPVPDSSSTPKPLHLRGADSTPQTPNSFDRAIHLTGMATRWTPTPTASTPKVPKSPKQPAYEPLSPVLPAATVPILPPSISLKTPRKISKVSKTGGKLDASSASQTRIKKQRTAKRTKGGSPASSAMAGSLRSQSVVSHADELSFVNDAVSAVDVKQEAATPSAVEDVGETTAEESNTTLRSGTIHSSPRRPPKRKRHESPPRESSGQATHVLWTRNFPKISASALERIGAHRSASTFAQPIKEREAPGYSNVILKPQDLKSIRAAINTGYKAGLAIASSMGDQGQASMLLPISEDLIPPKGIVNNAQLEKELMHIFSNAIMFNHDPHRSLGKGFEVATSVEESAGGEKYEVDENQLVYDTRAMFTDVEKIVGELRSAERRQEGLPGSEAEEYLPTEELTGDTEGATGSTAKRRRRA